MLKIKEIVKVSLVPTNSKFTSFIGRIGYVEEVNHDGTRVLFQGLTLEGRLAGTPIWLPTSSLVKEHSEEWSNALLKYEGWKQQIVREAESRRMQRNFFLEKVADQYGLTVEKVLEISNAVNTM